MNAVYWDTVGLIALWASTDQWHAPARPVYAQMVMRRTPVVTTTFILLECGNAAARRPYRSAVARFRQELELSRRLLVPTEEDWQRAWAAYTRSGPGGASIVDEVSFVVMRRLGITDVFTNDRHFQAEGFNPLF